MIEIVKHANFLVPGVKRIMMVMSIALVMTSCLDDQDTVAPTPIAYVSFYHGSPQTDHLTITVDNRVYNSNPFQFGNYFDYGNFYTGNRSFSFRNPGTSSSLLDTTVTLKASEVYSVFLTEKDDLFEPIIVEDELTNPGTNKARLRVAHLSPDAGDIDLIVGDSTQAFIGALSFGEVSDFKTIDIGTLKLAVHEAEGEELVTANDLSIRESRIYTLVIRGYQSAGQGTGNRLSLQLLRNYPNF